MRKTAVVLFATLFIACSVPINASAGPGDDIPTNAQGTGVHNTLVDLLVKADLVTTLQGAGPFTVFAPTDQAFTDAGINPANFNTQAEIDVLTDILLYHVVSGDVTSSDLSDGMSAAAVNNDPLLFSVNGADVKVNDASVTTADVTSSNGVIHVVDQVLLPPVDVYVSEGTFSAPHYQFYSDDAGNTPLTEIDISRSHKFHRLGESMSHAFYLGDNGYEAQSSAELTIIGDGSPTSGIVGSETFTVFFNDGFTIDDTLTYFCTQHSSMSATFTLTEPPNDIPTIASGTGIHNTLVNAVVQANLLATLSGDGPFTVFAPTDEAFTDLGVDLSTLSESELSNILLHHVYSGSVPASAVTDGMMAEMVNGDKVAFTNDGTTVTVGGATVITADVIASNGIIHVIDKVLLPPSDIPTTAGTTGVHNTLVNAIVQANLLATLSGDGPFTVFAPTDQAFTDAEVDLAALDTPEGNQALANILQYHVISGEAPASVVTDCLSADAVNGQPLSFTVSNSGVMVNDANVITTDVITSNGLIHVIDKVLTPTDTPRDIPRTAQCTGEHDSIVAAVVQAELLTTLQGDGPFTVFAPTDQAFTDAGIDLAALDTPEGKETLSDILLYHVVPSSVPSSAVTDCMLADAANNQPLSFTVGNGVMVNDANVIQADVMASNGIIHVIDKVLTPTDTPRDIPRTAQCTGAHDSLVAAVIQAELLTTLQGEGPFTVFAPTDQAFTDAGIDLTALDTPEGKQTLSDILLYHVIASEVPSSAVTDCFSADTVNTNPLSFTVDDSGVMVNNAMVVTPDVQTSNGVIHVVDEVLMPTATPNDIPRTAQCTGNHSTLVDAVIQAELLATLQGEGPFTVFAPTDQAFVNAGINLAALNTEEGKAQLTEILLHHVYISEAVLSSQITDGAVLSMANGDNITITVTDGSVMIGDATVTLADVATSNGVIHVVDKVIMPPSDEVEDSNDDTSSDEDDGIFGLSDGQATIVGVIGVVAILALIGGTVLFIRKKGAAATLAKDFASGGLMNQLQTVDESAYTAPSTQVTTQTVAEVQPVQTVEVIEQQPAVAEPQILRQWTDDAGYTWRAMDDGTTYWWTGSDWKKYG